jgi:hypothetical protein
MLLPYSRSDPIYFGHRFKPNTSKGYMSGGAGNWYENQCCCFWKYKKLINLNTNVKMKIRVRLEQGGCAPICAPATQRTLSLLQILNE